MCATQLGRPAEVAAPLEFTGGAPHLADALADLLRNGLVAELPLQGAFVDMRKDDNVGLDG
jgi:hypothetical protein